MFKKELYKNKDLNYFNRTRSDIISLVAEGPHKVLEVGCGDGASLEKLKELGKAEEVFGIEIDQRFADQHSRYLNGLIIDDVESINDLFSDNYFDYVLLGDVLEHLIRPDKVLEKCKKVLKNDGYIIASIPNIKYFSVLLNLILLDKFEYTEKGLLDNTHLRFFTKREIKNMFRKGEFKIVSITPILWKPLNKIDGKCHKLISKYVPFTSFFTTQYLIKAKKS